MNEAKFAWAETQLLCAGAYEYKLQQCKTNLFSVPGWLLDRNIQYQAVEKWN